MQLNSTIKKLNDKNYNVITYRNSNAVKIENFSDSEDYCIVDPSTIVNNQISVNQGQHFDQSILPLVEELINQNPIIYWFI